MTDNLEKVRALLLAFVMVVSVFGATVAFSGTAGAVTGVTSPTFSNGTVDERTKTTNQQISFTVNDVTEDNKTDTFYVNLPDVYEGNISRNSVTVTDDGNSQTTANFSLVDGPSGADPNGDDAVRDTIKFTTDEINGSATVDYDVRSSVG